MQDSREQIVKKVTKQSLFRLRDSMRERSRAGAKKGDRTERQAALLLADYFAALGDDPTDREVSIAYAMFRAGLLYDEVFRLRPQRQVVERQKRGAEKGGLARKKLDATQATAAAIEREDLIDAGHTKHDACQQLAEKFGVSYKTIERAH